MLPYVQQSAYSMVNQKFLRKNPCIQVCRWVKCKKIVLKSMWFDAFGCDKD